MKLGDVEKLIEALQKENEFCWFCKDEFGTNLPECPCRTDKQCAKIILKKYREKYNV